MMCGPGGILVKEAKWRVVVLWVDFKWGAVVVPTRVAVGRSDVLDPRGTVFSIPFFLKLFG